MYRSSIFVRITTMIHMQFDFHMEILYYAFIVPTRDIKIAINITSKWSRSSLCIYTYTMSTKYELLLFLYRPNPVVGRPLDLRRLCLFSHLLFSASWRICVCRSPRIRKRAALPLYIQVQWIVENNKNTITTLLYKLL